MSQENLELLRRVVDAINADEIPPDLIATDFELTNATTAVTDATYEGHEGAMKWRRELFDVFEEGRFEVDEILATGPDYVAIANRIVGRGSSSGAPLDMRWVSVLWFREGRLRRAAGYMNRHEALQALGLRE
jgi:ketosteroid isomerase-like protein